MARTKVSPTLARLFARAHTWLYRTTRGRLGARTVPKATGFPFGRLPGDARVVLVTTKGARSGAPRTVPLIGLRRGTGWVIVASFSGHDRHPAWYRNLQAHPTGTVVAEGRTLEVAPRVLEGDERSEVWQELVEVFPDYAEYERVTSRQIPVVALEPA